MRKFTPLLLLLAMTLMLVVSWTNVLSYNSKIESEYNSHMESAEKLETKEIYIDAVKEYEAALSLKNTDFDLAMKIVDMYDKLENKQKYVSACEKAITIDKTQWEPYRMLADYYDESQLYGKTYSILHKAQDAIGNTDEINKRLIEVMSRYSEAIIKYDSIKSFYYLDGGSVGYTNVEINKKFGVLSDGRNVKYECEYDDIGFLSEKLIPVKVENEYYYLDDNGYRKLVPDETAEYLGTFQSGYAPACFDGTWGYVDHKLAKYSFEYSYAGAFSRGLAAVEKGGKWAVINSSLEPITEFEFDEILLDDYGHCTLNGLFFAKKGGKYYLYQKDGKCISEGYEDAKLFVSDEPAAVKNGGKWTFISTEGTPVSDKSYDEVCSYNVGYAPFKQNGKWGCININGDVVIEPKFDLMESFANNGYAYAEEESESKFIIVTIYE